MIKPLLQNPAIQRIAAPLSLGLLLLLVWQLSFQQMNIPVYIVPKPSDIAMSMINQSGLLFGSLWVTLKITMLAFACAVIIGTLVAFVFVQSRVLEACFMPYAILFSGYADCCNCAIGNYLDSKYNFGFGCVRHVSGNFSNFNQYNSRVTQRK